MTASAEIMTLYAQLEKRLEVGRADDEHSYEYLEGGDQMLESILALLETEYGANSPAGKEF